MKASPRSQIFQITVDWLQPLLILFSLFLLLRGHNAPGGGFSGGLVAGSAFILAALAQGSDYARAQLPCSSATLVNVGLWLGIIAGLLPLVFGQAVFTGLWIEPKVPVIGTVGSFLIFDTGVYLLVMGFVMGVILHLAKDVQASAPESYIDTDQPTNLGTPKTSTSAPGQEGTGI